MARHSSGQTNFRLSKTLTIILVTLLAIVALVVFLLFNRSESNDTQDTAAEQECYSGDLEIPIAGDAALVTKAIDEFNASNPISRDFCITAIATASSEPAAVYLFSGTRAEAESALAKTTAIASSSPETWPQIAAVPAGVAQTEEQTPQLDNVDFRLDSAPSTAAIVALALADGDEQAAAQALAASPPQNSTGAYAVAQTEELPPGFTFLAVDGANLPVWAINTNAHADISEDQSRAGATFISFFDSPGEPFSTQEIDNVLTSANTLIEESLTSLPNPTDTLILVDTSSNMDNVVEGTQQSYHTVIGTEVAELSRQIGSLGNEVALTNFSSPLNPGVARGWRTNVAFPDGSNGEDAADAIVRLGTGGIPLTRSATLAAVATAAEQSTLSGNPIRLVIITSGSADELPDAEFLNSLEQLSTDNLLIEVIHVGNGEADTELSGWAQTHGGSARVANNQELLRTELRSAFGL